MRTSLPQPTRVRCTCGHTFTKQVVTRAVSELPAAQEAGLRCPQCGTWFHGFYTNTELQAMAKWVVEAELRWRNGNRWWKNEFKGREKLYRKRHAAYQAEVQAKLAELAPREEAQPA